MSQQDELLPLSLGLFSGPALEVSSLVDSATPPELSDQQAPEPAKPQSPISESVAISLLGAEDHSEASAVAHQARIVGNGDEIVVPLGSSLAPNGGLAGFADENSPVMSSSYPVRFSIDVVAFEEFHPGAIPDSQSPFGPLAGPQSAGESKNLFALESWPVDVVSGSIGISAEGAALVASVSGGASAVSSVSFASVNGTFDIVIRYSGDSTYQAAFTQAAAIWAQIIIADIPDLSSSQYGVIDDLLIDASIVSIDGQGGILGQAGPDLFRTTGSRLPAHGVMQFDSADVANMYSSDTWTGVILHEMGHILGIGTLWNYNSLLNGAKDYIGAHALAEYRNLIGNSNAASIPVEHDGGPGTAGAHWDEEAFDSELMTGWVDSGQMPISRLTIGSLEDIGYVVNYGAADPYTISGLQSDDFADTFGDASSPVGSVAANSSSAGTLQVTGDHDWFRVQLASGIAYTITVAGAAGGGGTLVDPYLRLHNGAGTIVAENDDMVIGSNRDSLLVFTPTSSGNYYINVGGYGDEYAGSYQVRVVVPVNGVHLATAAAEPFFGAAGSNTVSYANAPAVFGGTGVAVSLVAPAKNTGFAAGDTYNSIENLIGSSFNDKLTGDNGNNILEGGAGADVLAGGYGSDTVSYAGSTTGVVADLTSIRNNTGHAAGDTYVNIENLAGSSLNDALTGNKFANAIQGGAGDDTLCGSKGLDTLFGQLGNDVFRFMTAKDGVDTIGDFAAGQDAIGIAKSGFKINASVSLGTGDAFDFALHYFVSGPGNAQITAQNPAGVLATEAGHGQFLFNQTTDQLYWDQDGAGRKAAVLIAQFATPVDLHASDFILS